MKILKLRDIMNSKYANFFSYEEVFGFPDPKLKRFESEQKLLNEGLILTHDFNKSIKIIESNGFDILLLLDEKYENRFFVEINDFHTDFKKLFKIADNLGWYCAEIRGMSGKDRQQIKYTVSNLQKFFEKYSEIWLLFEPKYDIELNRHEYPYLYHFTKEVYWDKIKQQGLTPRNQEKVSNHPERIYLALSPSAAEKFGRKSNVRLPLNKETGDYSIPPNHNSKSEIYNGMILKIDTRNIPDYFKIYQDPNFYKEGCFTLNTIPFSAIHIFKRFNLNY